MKTLNTGIGDSALYLSHLLNSATWLVGASVAPTCKPRPVAEAVMATELDIEAGTDDFASCGNVAGQLFSEGV